jgi:hypothetical protein
VKPRGSFDLSGNDCEDVPALLLNKEPIADGLRDGSGNPFAPYSVYIKKKDYGQKIAADSPNRS